MKKQLLFVGISLVASAAILGISLLKTAHARAASFTQPQTSHKRLYLGQEIKPDHLLYPVVAAADQARLASASPDQKVALAEHYTQKRLRYVQYLLDQSEPGMAVMTLQRAHSLLLQTTEIILAGGDQVQAQEVLLQLESHHQFNLQLQQSLSAEYSAPLELMSRENLVAQQKLQSISE
jgi:hypothetical protein